MTTLNDNHDTSRDVYVSHKLYLERNPIDMSYSNFFVIN